MRSERIENLDGHETSALVHSDRVTHSDYSRVADRLASTLATLRITPSNEVYRKAKMAGGGTKSCLSSSSSSTRWDSWLGTLCSVTPGAMQYLIVEKHHDVRNWKDTTDDADGTVLGQEEVWRLICDPEST